MWKLDLSPDGESQGAVFHCFLKNVLIHQAEQKLLILNSGTI